MYIITSAISGTLGFIFLIIWALLVVISFLNILRTHTLNLPNKLLWILIIVVVPILGSLIYMVWKTVKNP